jgi:kynurenine formamidase
MDFLEWWQNIECVDLSVPLDPDFPVSWPGLPPFRKRTLNWFEDLPQPGGEVIRSRGRFYDQSLELDEHTGTHVDFPQHMLPPDELRDVQQEFGDEVPLGAFAGPAAVIDATAFLDQAEAGKSPRIPVEIARGWEQAHGRIKPGEVVLIDTGYVDRYFTALPAGSRLVQDVITSGRLPGWPVPSNELLEWLAQRGVRHLGISSPSIGALDDAKGTHLAGMKRGMTYAEMLRSLNRLPARGALYVGVPLNIAGQSGSPIRAVAFTPRQ